MDSMRNPRIIQVAIAVLMATAFGACTNPTGLDPSRVEGVWSVLKAFDHQLDWNPAGRSDHGYYEFRPDGTLVEASDYGYADFRKWKIEDGRLHIITPCRLGLDPSGFLLEEVYEPEVYTEVYEVSLYRSSRMTLRFQEAHQNPIPGVSIAYEDSLQTFEVRTDSTRAKISDVWTPPRVKGDKAIFQRAPAMGPIPSYLDPTTRDSCQDLLED